MPSPSSQYEKLTMGMGRIVEATFPRPIRETLEGIHVSLSALAKALCQTTEHFKSSITLFARLYRILRAPLLQCGLVPHSFSSLGHSFRQVCYWFWVNMVVNWGIIFFLLWSIQCSWREVLTIQRWVNLSLVLPVSMPSSDLEKRHKILEDQF